VTSTELVYQDPAAAIEDRVRDLLSRMTIEEKVAQLSGRFPFELVGEQGFDLQRAADLIPHGLGQVSAAAAINADEIEPLAAFLDELQRYLREETRLGIPAICHNEAPCGLMHNKAANFPAPIALAATWDPPSIERMNRIVRRQMRAVGIHQALAPVLDVARDARWGRVPETFGEDPYLASAMAVAFVRGLQSGEPNEMVLATAKHFVAYGASQGGRNLAPVSLSDQDLFETYVKPFEAAIRHAGLASVMSAYNEVNGQPCSGSDWLLTDVLRDRLGFEGFVVADYGAIGQLVSVHAIAQDAASAGLRALQAGLDVELPTTSTYNEQLLLCAQGDEALRAALDRSVSRVLAAKFKLGLFESPFTEPTARANFASPASADVALDLARSSLVLLANDGLLPLSRTLGRVAVIGPNAHSVRNLFSGYTPPAGVELMHAILSGSQGTMAGLFESDGHADGGDGKPPLEDSLAPFSTYATSTPPEVLDDIAAKFSLVPTVLDAVKSVVAPATDVGYDAGCALNGNEESIERAVDVASGADVAIVVLGDKTGWAYDATGGEGRDRSSLDLPGTQAELLAAICRTGTPVVVVLVNGRPLPVPATDPPVRAVLQAWQPGAVGGRAIAECLFGLVNPTGKLPISIPRSGGQCPTFYGRKPAGAYDFSGLDGGHDYTNEPGAPAFAFGHGLSYTTFAYDVSPPRLNSDSISLAVSITNTGARAGGEVVQIYIRPRSADLTQPLQRLVAFQRVHLDAGESRRIVFSIHLSQVATLDRRGHHAVDSGPLQLMVASSAADIRETTYLHIPDNIDLGPRIEHHLAVTQIEPLETRDDRPLSAQT
jgi:beta-glucosidase